MPFIEGTSREQFVLLPDILDDYIAPNNPVRFLDAFVLQLDMAALGFARTSPPETGRPAYDPRDLLKLYLWGYLNRVRSSRRLEVEAGRNIEVMWLLRRLQPDFKTIADFRKDNVSAFKPVFREFTKLCRSLNLFGAELVAIDGSKFKAQNARDRNFTEAKLERQLQEIDAKLERYLRDLDDQDQAEASCERPTAEDLQKKIASLKEQKQKKGALLTQIKECADAGPAGKQISLTDPDSRSMPKSPQVDVGYNVQIAVDAKHKLIVEQDVTNEVTDQGQLTKVAKEAQKELGAEKLEIVADRGYYDGDEVKQCAQAGITCLINKPNTSANTKLGLFGKEKFRYDKEKDCYICPAGQALIFRFETTELGRRIRYYRPLPGICAACPLRTRCTRNKQSRRITRWVDEHLLEDMAARIRKEPDKLKRRKAIVEHPFGTIKYAWGHRDFRMKGLTNVRAEFSLSATAYNIRRAITILGVTKLVNALSESQ